MRKFVLSLVCAAAIALGSGGAAFAADDSDTYAPAPPPELTLSGSTVSPLCAADVPWIDYDVVLTDPASRSTGHSARLVMTDGTNTTTIELGDLVNNELSGRVLWPGASVGADGRGNGWPGWAYENGAWVETSGNFAWTRGNISATIEVNPSLSVPLSYPPSTPQCLTSPAHVTAAAGGSASLPSTGGDAAAVVPVLWAAGGLIVLGGAVLMVRRARRSRG